MRPVSGDMMMKPLALLAAAFVALAPPTANAQVSRGSLLGRWACATSAEDVWISRQVIYSADGVAESILIMNADSDDSFFQIVLRAGSSWELNDNGTLSETFFAIQPIRFWLDGEDMTEDGAFEGFAEELAGELNNTTSVSDSVAISAGSMTMRDQEGAAISCVR
jgi:hypothetical protein